MVPGGTLTNSCFEERLEMITENHDGLKSEEQLYFYVQIKYYLSDIHHAMDYFFNKQK